MGTDIIIAMSQTVVDTAVILMNAASPLEQGALTQIPV